jgi:hypothetical protein
MKASIFAEAQKAFILKQGADGLPPSREMIHSQRPLQIRFNNVRHSSARIAQS